MRLKPIFAVLFLCLAAGSGFAAETMEVEAAARSAELSNDGAATTEVLLKSASSWDGKAYGAYPGGDAELTLVRIVIPSNTALPWHTHPMPNAAYVVGGRLTVVQHDTGLERILGAGDVLPEMVGTPHRGYSGPEPVELLVFYAGTPGMPLSEPAAVE